MFFGVGKEFVKTAPGGGIRLARRHDLDRRDRPPVDGRFHRDDAPAIARRLLHLADLGADLEIGFGGGLLVATTEAEMAEIEVKAAIEREAGLARRIAAIFAADVALAYNKAAQAYDELAKEAEAFLNGKALTKNPDWQKATTVEVQKQLTSGDNELIIKATNKSGSAGLVAKLLVETADLKRVIVETAANRMDRASLTFRIESEMWAQPIPLNLYLKTEVDLETGRLNVSEALG